ncbi:MAG TPA: hypothetical protein VHP14_15095 [Anaerolineales bacterium]|nr:hypothetical protein [Anaerolineales bacterium]
MQIAKVIVGGVLLFLGRELNFLFSAGMGVLIGFRLTPILPAQWPGYYDYIFIAVLGIVAASIALINERTGYFFSGFLAGGYLFAEYAAPDVLALPLVPFLLGGVVGSLLLGFSTEWGTLIVSCLIGAYYVGSYFPLSSTAQILVTAGLFIVGGLVQAVTWYMQRK